MDKMVYVKRLAKLRERMERYDIDAYLIVSDDYHASEYVGDYFKCREYISGFSGSAGVLVVTKGSAGLWTDGRYFIQAEAQLEKTGITLYKMGEVDVPTIPEYLYSVLDEGQSLGYDGRTVQCGYAAKIKEGFYNKHIRYVEDVDLVGEIWENRPEMSHEPVWLLDTSYVGKSRGEKLEELRKSMTELSANYHLIATLDDIAWLYNIRGNDIAYNPVVLAYTIVDVSGKNTILYVNRETLSEEVLDALLKDGVCIKPYHQVYEDLEQLPIDSLLLDENRINVALMRKIPEKVHIIQKSNPTYLAKAIKTSVEIENERKAHIKDGIAVTRLIYWLKNVSHTNEFKNGEITERRVSEYLLNLRREQDGFIEQSFAPIIASGVHGAIVHYEPVKETDIPIGEDTFVLMDTGGQYYEGTTDITRTVAIGKLTRIQKEHYTAVLRGNLNLAAAYFKYGCTGANLDYLARNPLWELGLDYNHGTGHGVGYLLNVHEGPNAIRLKNGDGTVGTVLEAGMITSDEPGVYLENQYGIRLENLILCQNADKTDMGQYMRFETLTMVPFDRDAILPDCMSEKEKECLDAYHERVYENISPYLDGDEKKWLYEVTRPIDNV